MDMAVANLLKHKIRFERCGYYGMDIYYSKKIENLESLGARSLYDLCLNHMQSFYQHIFSTIIHECSDTIGQIEIKVKVIQGRGGPEEQDLIGFIINNPGNNAYLFSGCSTVQIYAFDDDKFRTDKAFYIVVEAEAYVTRYNFPDFTKK